MKGDGESEIMRRNIDREGTLLRGMVSEMDGRCWEEDLEVRTD